MPKITGVFQDVRVDAVAETDGTVTIMIQDGTLCMVIDRLPYGPGHPLLKVAEVLASYVEHSITGLETTYGDITYVSQ